MSLTLLPGVYFEVIVGLGAMQSDPPGRRLGLSIIYNNQFKPLLGLYEPSYGVVRLASEPTYYIRVMYEPEKPL